MRFRLPVLFTLLVLLACFAAPAVAQAQGVFVYWGEGGVGPATAAGQYWDLTIQTGLAPFLTYGSELPPDLSTYDLVVLSQNSSFSPASTTALADYFHGGGVLLALGEEASANPPFVAAMNSLSLEIGAAPLYLAPVSIDPSWRVTTYIDPHPLTTGVTSVGYSGSCAVTMPDPGWSLVREDGGVESILGMVQYGSSGWFILCADANMFSDAGRVDMGVDVLSLYDNARIIANAIWGPPVPTGWVMGNVTDAVTGLPIPFAQIRVGASPLFTTDEGGFYAHGMPPGQHTVTCSMSGYVQQSAEVTFSDGVTTSQDFALMPEPPDVTPEDPSFSDPATGVTVSFENVTSSGDITVTPVEPTHALPSGYRLVGDNYFHISTAASYTGRVRVTVPYDPIELDSADGSGLDFCKWMGSEWSFGYDITSAHDPVNHTVSGEWDMLSDFAIVAPYSPVSTPASSTWSMGLLVVVAFGIFGLAFRRGRAT